MLPRLRPAFGAEELVAALTPSRGAVEKFETEVARAMEAEHAVAFDYGRTGVWALLRALGLKDAEVVMPAYTCIVVSHAVVESGNIPVFVDCEPGGFTMSLEMLERSITPKTRMIIPTHLFGYPMDVRRIEEIVGGRDIFILQDCAHSFGARKDGELVSKAGGAALFAFSISKILSSIFGGAVTTDDGALAAKLRSFRDGNFKGSGAAKSLKRLAYLMAVYPAFWPPVYTIVNRMEEASLLDSMTQYYSETEIDMPSDYLDFMTGVEARVGLAQLKKYKDILKRRVEISERYGRELADVPGLTLPPIVDGATYSHYVCLADDRERWISDASKKGLQLGRLIEYSIPEMKSYARFRREDCPVARGYSAHTLNVPCWPGIEKHQGKIIDIMHEIGNGMGA